MTIRSLVSYRRGVALAALTASCALLSSSASAQWVTFANETATRMPVGPGLNTASTSTGDLQEKDYAWGDVDHDGDIDLVCVRKQPFTSTGRFPNILFMNEGTAQGHSINGVLVDRTALYAIAVDMNNDGVTDPQPASDQGFNTPTNDRDVVLADVNSDGWLDIVTATTLSDGAGKIIGHPRIYMNLGSVKGVWRGFRFEPTRIPDMANPSFPNAQPRFCSVAAGDVTGDGYVDLYFGDYDSGGVEQYDYNNKLLINAGASNPGYFSDSGTERMTANPGLLSAFGAASVICDMNNDGVLDVVKQTSLNAPLHVAIQHNNPANVGYFPDPTYKIVNTNAPYFVSAGDLNNDGRLDLVTSDDGADRYLINTGNAGDGTSNFSTFTFSFQTGGDDGFASQSIVTDLNNDGWNDVLISDVDVDISGCSRRLHIYRNLGNAPSVTLQEQSVGGLNNSAANMSGTHNVAVFDLNGDGWKDLIIGRCTGTFIWMNVPPAGIAFSYPSGLPGYLTPNQTKTFNVQLNGIGGAGIVPNSGKQYVSINGGAFTQSAMTSLGGNLYQATLPAVACTNRVAFYFSADLTAGGTKFDPPSAPASPYLAVAALGTDITLDEAFEGSVATWSVSDSPTLTAGTFEVADPNGTLFNGASAAPEDDATGGAASVKAFVSLNGIAGQGAALSDIDGGSTALTSPTINLAGTDATISYSRWFFASAAGNFLTTQVSSNNGSSWTTVHTVTSTISDGTNTIWENASFTVGAYVTPTSQVRVRFIADGSAAGAVVEAGIDNFQVQELQCTLPCVADVTGDGSVNVADLLSVISAWGPCPAPPAACPADINSDAQVNVADLLGVISAWGACP